jgi:hypothetical protein
MLCDLRAFVDAHGAYVLGNACDGRALHIAATNGPALSVRVIISRRTFADRMP